MVELRMKGVLYCCIGTVGEACRGSPPNLEECQMLEAADDYLTVRKEFAGVAFSNSV